MIYCFQASAKAVIYTCHIKSMNHFPKYNGISNITKKIAMKNK